MEQTEQSPHDPATITCTGVASAESVARRARALRRTIQQQPDFRRRLVVVWLFTAVLLIAVGLLLASTLPPGPVREVMQILLVVAGLTVPALLPRQLERQLVRRLGDQLPPGTPLQITVGRERLTSTTPAVSRSIALGSVTRAVRAEGCLVLVTPGEVHLVVDGEMLSEEAQQMLAAAFGPRLVDM